MTKKIKFRTKRQTPPRKKKRPSRREFEQLAIPTTDDLTREELKMYRFCSTPSGAHWEEIMATFSPAARRARKKILKSMVERGYIWQMGGMWYISVTRDWTRRMNSRFRYYDKCYAALDELNEMLDLSMNPGTKVFHIARTLVERVRLYAGED